jgi:hypothetical protein
MIKVNSVFSVALTPVLAPSPQAETGFLMEAFGLLHPAVVGYICHFEWCRLGDGAIMEVERATAPSLLVSLAW